MQFDDEDKPSGLFTKFRVKKSTFVKGKKLAWLAYAGAAVVAIATGPFSLGVLIWGGIVTMALKPKELKIKGFNWFDSDDVNETDDFFDTYFKWFVKEESGSYNEPTGAGPNSRYSSYEDFQNSNHFKDWQSFLHNSIDSKPFTILGITPEASPDEIKVAYRKKMKEYHPDLGPPSEIHIRTKRTAVIIEAYKQICDAVAKQGT
jgi:DnaJ-domain-containing protein 1